MAAEKLEVSEDGGQRSLALDVSFDDVVAVWNWKEIKNCPGRHVLKKKVGNASTPIEFMTQSMRKLEDLNLQIGGQHIHELQETFGLKNDKIFLVFFRNGGGLMSYEKVTEDDEKLYVHTLNTPSGMLRKLSAMRVSYRFDAQAKSFLIQEKCTQSE